MVRAESFVLDKELLLKDEAQYLGLIQSFYKANGDKFDNLNIEDMVINKNVFYCMVMNDRDVVCLCRFAKMYDRQTMYCIRQINTLKAYQHKGYAALCYVTIQDYVKSKGGRKIISFVSNDNKNSQALHKKCGYNKVIPNKTLQSTNYYFEGSYCYEKRF